MQSPVVKRLLGLTDVAYKIVEDKSTADRMTKSEYVEWVILCQHFPAAEAAALWDHRRRRGNRGVVPEVQEQ